MHKPSKFDWDEWVALPSDSADAERVTDDLATAAETMECLTNALVPQLPPPGVRARLMESIKRQNRFVWLADQVAVLLNVARDKALSYLDLLDEAGEWQTSPFANVSLIHVEGGPAVTSAITGFVKVAAGASFPEHGHLGDEKVLIMQGAIMLPDGTVCRAGDLLDADNSVHHEVVAEDGPPLIYLAVVHSGIVVDGEVFSADYPDL